MAYQPSFGPLHERACGALALRKLPRLRWYGRPYSETVPDVLTPLHAQKEWNGPLGRPHPTKPGSVEWAYSDGVLVYECPHTAATGCAMCPLAPTLSRHEGAPQVVDARHPALRLRATAFG